MNDDKGLGFQNGTLIKFKPNEGGDFKDEWGVHNAHRKNLKITLSDLQIRLRDFKDAVKNSDVTGPAVGVIGMWLPFFTADFKTIGRISPQTVKAFYLAVAAVMTFFLLRNVWNMLRIWIMSRLKKLDKDARMKYEKDPDKLAEMMCPVPDDGHEDNQ